MSTSLNLILAKLSWYRYSLVLVRASQLNLASELQQSSN